MAMLQPFTTASPILANFDFFDWANGAGIQYYKAVITETSAGEDQILTTEDPFSQKIETQVGTGAAGVHAATKVVDLDFDLTQFQNTTTIQGTAIFSSAFMVRNGNAANSEVEGYIVAKVRKWDGTTETEIASAQSQTITPGAGALYPKSDRVLMPITIPLTNFAIGDTLRLTLELWTAGLDAGIAGYGYVVHDPQDRDGESTGVTDGINPSTDGLTTITKIGLPIKTNQ